MLDETLASHAQDLEADALHGRRSSEDDGFERREGMTISDPMAMARHLAGLPKPLPIRILREPDWQAIRGLVRIDRRVDLSVLLKRLRYAVNEGAVDESWVGTSVIISYNAQGKPWSYRSVVRSLQRGGFVADAPIELRQGQLALPGNSWLSLPGDELADPRFTRLPIKTVHDLPTRMAFMSMIGGDLQLRSGRCSEINHPKRVGEIIERLIMSPSMLLTTSGDHGACEAVLEATQPGVPVLMLRCNHRGMLPVRRGRVVFLTGMLGREQFTLKTVVLKVDGERLALRRPKEVFRLQRRKKVRYELRHQSFTVSLWDGMNMNAVEGVVDLSEEGIGVLINPDSTTRVGDVYKLVLSMGKKQTMGVTGICVSCGESGWHYRRCGFEFVDIDDRSRRVIQHWLDKFGRPVGR
ncbi:MAG: PilZ domain-containing protein [Bradymonadia bacterium]